MKPLRLWPQRLVGQVTLVLMLAVALEFIGSSLLFERSRLYPDLENQTRRVAEQLVTAETLLEDASPDERAARAAVMSTRITQLSWSVLPTLVDGGRDAEEEFREEFLEAEPGLRGRDLRLRADIDHAVPRDTHLKVALKLRDGSWMALNTRIHVAPWAVLLSGVGSAFTLGLGVIVAAALVLRNLSRPLRALAEAADKVGKGAQVRIAESGAGDLKLVAKAFNAMQDRIAGLLNTRTEALAAVGHDLRTPLARLRLRAGFVTDPDAREALEADVDEMTSMLDSLLAYLGGQEDPEPRRRTDLAAIAMTLVNDAADAERPASYAGLDHLPVLARPLSVKRAISNIVENALHYGGDAALTLTREGDTAVLAIEDNGPGIPEAEMVHVLQPFHRLDSARTRNTAGLGLGLTIVQQILQRESGTLVLRNRPQGGLRVEIRLPAL
ncbi:ATP-binding protein [Caulobacter sp. FWC2]|uniref:ATP-binding protein n=1 Tax=Caulobacter sp. FWC2 TaxID=69664 RepID=UPI000C159062|nr:ATP-binding protein [Caulobacter sp. FWC2]PIB91859.1 two-component sensor histidine kinase [Caulobacter sp. FWC2]